MNDDELLDLVNEKNEVIGTIWRSESSGLLKNKRGYIRAANLFLQNDKKELWIPTRTANKKIAPNGLDFSAGGHVESGSTYLETMLKETQEELGLVLKSTDIELIGKTGIENGYYFCEIFLYRTNNTPSYNTDDFVSAEWISVSELVTLLKNGVTAKASLLETVEGMFALDGTVINKLERLS